MDVLPVMNSIIAIKCSIHQNDGLGSMVLTWIILIKTIVFLISGCQHPNPGTPSVLGRKTDITEDLYHRLKAGLFIAGKDPVIFNIEKTPNPSQKLRFPFYNEKAPHKMVRIYWERGSFWVKSDDRALVVIYMDVEATYSHVQIATLEGFQNSRQFRETYKHPIR